MNKNKNTKPITNVVGADDLVRPQNSRGITLIALIITIIVMLILVGVSITIALKGGLFETTKKAAKGTEAEKNAEQELANGRVKIDGVWYDSIEDYVGGQESENQTDPERPEEPVTPPEEPPVSYLGRTATIDGQKYIVLYDAGEQGENLQLVSANVLEPSNVYLGKGDGQIDWTNASVIAEADLDNNSTLDNIEKSIYSYNHIVETLNNKCASLVGNTNTDIVSVRSVGSNPTNPSSENATLYTSDFLANNPTNEPGKYNGVGKSTDENYLTDYNRMQELGIIKAENGQEYWMASRFVHIVPGTNNILCCRKVSDEDISDISYSTIFRVFTNQEIANSPSLGVRAVISLKSDAISKYLD